QYPCASRVREGDVQWLSYHRDLDFVRAHRQSRPGRGIQAVGLPDGSGHAEDGTGHRRPDHVPRTAGPADEAGRHRQHDLRRSGRLRPGGDVHAASAPGVRALRSLARVAPSVPMRITRVVLERMQVDVRIEGFVVSQSTRADLENGRCTRGSILEMMAVGYARREARTVASL